MKCVECGHEFEGRRCTYCGVLPKENESKPPTLEEILGSRKFLRRLFTSKHTSTVRFADDDIPWNE